MDIELNLPRLCLCCGTKMMDAAIMTEDFRTIAHDQKHHSTRCPDSFQHTEGRLECPKCGFTIHIFVPHASGFKFHNWPDWLAHH